jgi:hypothetical protein
MYEPRSGRPAPSGNENERLDVTSGKVLAIDHCQLANRALLDQLKETSNKESVLKRYGAATFDLPLGGYGIYRDADNAAMVIYPVSEKVSGEDDQGEPNGISVTSLVSGSSRELARVILDTRAVVYIDASILEDSETLNTYVSEWQNGEQKRARDFLRERGGAVRYGFRRNVDELKICAGPRSDIMLIRGERDERAPRFNTSETSDGSSAEDES